MHRPRDDADIIQLAARRKRATDDSLEDNSSHPPPPPPPSGPDKSEIKFRIKKYNETIKLIASAFSGSGVGVFGVGFLQPLIRDPFKFAAEYRPIWYAIGVGLHIAGHVIMRFNLKKED